MLILLHPVIHLDNGLPRCLYRNACVLGAKFSTLPKVVTMPV